MLIYRFTSYCWQRRTLYVARNDKKIGERRTGNDLGDGGRGLMQALFRDLGGGNEKSQYG
jgi:hypothetical protein